MMRRQNEKTAAAAGGPPKLPPPLELTDLSQLEKLSHGEPILVDVLVRGTPIRFTGRRLKPAETKEIKMLLERALPPVLAPEKEGEQPRYDFRNPKYLEESEDNRRVARALALYSAFPIFRAALEKEDGPVDQKRIVDFIEGRELEDDILEILFERVSERIAAPLPHLGFS